MSLENLALSLEMLTDYEYRNPESIFADDLTLKSSNHDVLGYLAQLVELRDLIASLQGDVSSDEIMQQGERIFNLECGKNVINSISDEIVVEVVEVEGDRLVSLLEELKVKIEGLEKAEITTEEMGGDEEELIDKLLVKSSMVTRRNPVDYHYELVEIQSDNKTEIAAFENAIAEIESILLKVLSQGTDAYKKRLAFHKLKRLADEGCKYNDKEIRATEQVMTVKQVNGDFNLLSEKAIAVLDAVKKWYSDHYEEKPVIDENPAPESLKDRQCVFAYQMGGLGKYSPKHSYSDCQASSVNNYKIQDRANSGFWSGSGDNSLAKHGSKDWYEHPKLTSFHMFYQSRSAYARTMGDDPTSYYGQSSTSAYAGIGTYYSRGRIEQYYDVMGMQFSTGKNAIVDTADPKLNFNPYGKKNIIEWDKENGILKVTFTGCNFPGVCIVQPHRIWRDFYDKKKRKSKREETGLLANVSNIELKDGNAVVTIRGLTPYYFKKDIGNMHIAYLGSHHCITDAFTDAKVTLYSNAFDEPFINTNYPVEKGVKIEKDKISFLDIEPKGKAFSFIQIHANPSDINQPVGLGLTYNRKNVIEYNLADNKQKTEFSNDGTLPFSIIHFQLG